jgi:hypothetical protein
MFSEQALHGREKKEREYETSIGGYPLAKLQETQGWAGINCQSIL